MRRNPGSSLGTVLAFACLACGQLAANGQPPKEAFFPILPWELPPRSDEFRDAGHGLKSLSECGFTVAAFVKPEQLAECERLGLRAIVSWRADPLANWATLGDDEIGRTG